MKDTTVYHVGVVDGNGTCYSHNAHAQLLSEISKLFSLHKVHSVMLSSISYTIKTVYELSWSKTQSILIFELFMHSIWPSAASSISFNKAKKILKSCVALIHLIVGCTPTRWKNFRFLSWLPPRGAQFFPGFSLISLILSNIFTPLEKLRREWIS